MSDSITPKQALLLWCLIGKHGQALQGAIIPKVEAKDRQALVAVGYLKSEKRARGALYLTVEDKGWHWAEGHLREALPPNFQVLQDWLTRLHEHLGKSGATLAEFIGPPPKAEPDDVGKTATVRQGSRAKAKPKSSRKSAGGKRGTQALTTHPKPRGRTHTPAEPPSAEQVRARIEQAYLTLTGGRRAEAVPLSKLRAQLPDLDRTTVDSGLLRILQGDPTARLGQISDPKALSQEDREAAFSPGGEPFNVLWIQS